MKKIFHVIILAFFVGLSRAHKTKRCPDLKPMNGFRIEQV